MITEHTGFAHLSDLPCWQLRCGDASAVISRYGAQVLSYQPKPGQEVLWLSPQSNWHQQQPIRGGIPICWPWFGSADPEHIPDAASQPSHGLVRNRLWQLHAMEHSNTASSLTLCITIDELPHTGTACTLYLKLSLSDSLTVELSTDAVIPQQAALHSYFAVAPLLAEGDAAEPVSQLTIQGLGSHYYDKVTHQQRQETAGQTRIQNETDRIYSQPSHAMVLAHQQRQLQLIQTGQDHAVLWNPWQAKSQAMSDMPDLGYQQFMCLETARLHWQPQALRLQQQIRLDATAANWNEKSE